MQGGLTSNVQMQTMWFHFTICGEETTGQQKEIQQGSPPSPGPDSSSPDCSYIDTLCYIVVIPRNLFI